MTVSIFKRLRDSFGWMKILCDVSSKIYIVSSQAEIGHIFFVVNPLESKFFNDFYSPSVFWLTIQQGCLITIIRELIPLLLETDLQPLKLLKNVSQL
jgi:hypothetical protein